MKKKKPMKLEIFLNLYEDFINLSTWTKQKHKKFKEVNQFLEKHLAASIRVNPNSKYNHCSGNHTFTIIKVPKDKLGKLYQFRNNWVLIRCDSYKVDGWSQYWNEIYLLDKPFDLNLIENIKSRFGDYFII